MPLICMPKSVGSKIGESIGELEEVDVADGCAGWGRYLRIRVNIDLRKPLERDRTLHLGDKVTWVNFQYEKLPLFCFLCGCIFHGPRGCLAKRGGRVTPTEGEKQWGAWLRADEAGRKLKTG